MSTGNGEALRVRVAVVGGGISGLKCAQLLVQREGLAAEDVLVLEARPELGGRVKQSHSLIEGVPVDLGAELLHGNTTSLVDLVEAEGWERQELFCWAQGDGGPDDEPVDGCIGMYYLGAEKRLLRFDDPDPDFVKFNEMLWQLGETEPASVKDDVRNMKQWLEDQGCPQRMLGMAHAGWANTHCAPMHEIGYAGSVLAEEGWIPDGKGDSRLKLPHCFGSVVNKLAAGVRHELSWPVSKISAVEGGGVRLESCSGQVVLAERVVLTVPTPVMHRGDVKFDPPLPTEKLEAWQQLGMGRATKVFMVFSNQIAPPECHGIICADCRFPEFWFKDLPETAGPARQLATAFLTCDFADRLDSMSEEAIISAAVAQLDEVFGLGAKGAFIAGEVCDWKKDAQPGQNFGRPVRIGEAADAGLTLSRCKAACQAQGLGGFVLSSGGGIDDSSAYFRQADVASLRGAAIPLAGSWLCLKTTERSSMTAASKATTATERPGKLGEIRVVVVASNDEFDETCYTDPEVDVSTAGNGRKYATHAMIRCLLSSQPVRLVAVLILDFQADSRAQVERPLAVEGPEALEVHIHLLGRSVPAWRGDFEQLLVAGAGELEADVAISTSPRRDMLSLLHGAVRACSYAVMGHDYNLPYGPWGARTPNPLANELHAKLLEQTVALCTSRHLAEYLQRWSSGRVEAVACYCADYGYFDGRACGLNSVPVDEAVADAQPTVTFVSPCPAKGLCIFIRLALELPWVRFLAVSTLWTKAIHETLLQQLPNVEVVRGGPDVDAIYRRTAVLVVPSIWSEAFGLVALEAQLQGIPVVSTDAYGLREANMIEELRVPNVKLVQDMKIRTLHRGHSIDELEFQLSVTRAEAERDAGEVERSQHAAQAHFYVASPEEAAGFVDRVRALLEGPERRAELGSEAKLRSEDFVRGRQGAFLRLLRELSTRTSPVGFVDFLTLTVFFHVLMGAVDEEAQCLHDLSAAQKQETLAVAGAVGFSTGGVAAAGDGSLAAISEDACYAEDEGGLASEGALGRGAVAQPGLDDSAAAAAAAAGAAAAAADPEGFSS
ncbi:unnamed protein product [Polarella glacialis]|uniref:Amine oxidase n=1 Tax=Polarella glacialis TaxID=89957 RepID=A0A813EXL5_POLGL|nr:unnamed protein product [Polarella glacialis]